MPRGEPCKKKSQRSGRTKCMCVYKDTHAVSLIFTWLLFCVCVCAEEGSKEKINEEETSSSKYSLGSYCMFDSECGSDEEIRKEEDIAIPQAGLNLGLHAYKGIRISKSKEDVLLTESGTRVNCMEQKGQGCTMRWKGHGCTMRQRMRVHYETG